MSLLPRLSRFRQRYWARIAATIGIVGWALFLIGWQVDQVNKWLVNSGAVNLIILTLVLDISYAVVGLFASKQIRISEDEDENSRALKTELRDIPVKQAELLEYSGYTVQPLVKDLLDRGCQVRMLVKDPETVGPCQRRRIFSSLDAYTHLLSHGHERLIEIRCYRAQASLRGRLLGNELINVGWYTPFLENGVANEMEIIGAGNPLVTARLGTPEGRDLERMFKGLFEALWDAEDTKKASDVLAAGNWQKPSRRRSTGRSNVAPLPHPARK